ncbi:SusC/RagA family TonB-linked outer membrane protein [Draconibacterium halophilum]|uniref:SusC/RagA family TonB-linked outer membrane protein n=1 Tax=Draconibacterium halophilum TaxID=2706887 RepID=A0A6C0RIY8_9BACT|nr:SusC/RagA family TonB-linked outer membrane protein [Draconibacterium halophilum]QIA09575.1 SusC/RagA family TonB-linked outer membrane protein [Draconibacterium halophilum]
MKKLALLIFCALLVGVQFANAQTKRITGTITSAEDGMSIPGVSVMVKGTTVGTITNLDGVYEIQAPEDAEVLIFSFVGMKTIEAPINGSVVNAVLEPDVLGLDEVMVVAFGTAKKESLTGSAAVVGQKEIESRSVSSVAQVLTGSTTGIQTTAGSGQPGSSPAIRIRGVGTLNTSASPLIILDGIQYEGNISSLNPGDISSMTVLKDAASTALYGSRAANGVIIITTKTGSKGAESLRVSLKAQAGVIGQALPDYEAVNAQNYYELQSEAFAQARYWSGNNDNIGDARAYAYENIYSQLRYNPFVGVANDQIVGSDGKINPNAVVGFPDLDWYDAAKQTGYRQNYDLSLAGGSEKTSYYYSLGYLDERGYVIKSDYERFNTRFNIDFDVRDWFQMGSNIYGTLITSNIGSLESATYANPFRNARMTAPIYPIFLVDQETGDYILDGAGEKQYDDGGLHSRPINAGRNAIAELNWNNDDYKRNNVGNRSYAKFTLMEGLSATINAGVDIQNYHYKGFENAEIGDGAPTGRMDESRYRRTTVNFNQLVNYEKTINELHNLSVMVGHESYKREYTYQRGFKNQFIVDGIYELNNFVNTSTNTSYTTNKTTEGYFARLKYNYDNKYYIEGSYRRDGSSAFHKDVRWGNFYSVGGSWRIDQEEFISSVNWVNNLKLRASYGEVGNDNIGSYGYQALYETYPNAETPGIRWSTVGNTALAWEVNKTFDIAVDFALFDKISGTLEWYNRKSDDLLYEMPLPPTMGLLDQPRNIASLVNRGVEIHLQGEIVRTSDFTWNMSLMGSTIDNEITSIPDPFVNGTKRWSEGHSIYDFWLRKFYDVNPENGATRFHVWEDVTNEAGEVIGAELGYDDNGEPVLTEDMNDAGYGYVGASAFPTLQGSIGNNFTFKGFTLTTLLTYSLGGEMYDGIYRGMLESTVGESYHPDVMNSWMEPGDVAAFPRLQYANSDLYAASDFFLISSDYLNIRNITLSYDFSNQLIKNWGLGQLSVFVTGENLYMFTARKGLNPTFNFSGTQDGMAYNPSRSFILGFNVQF